MRMSRLFGKTLREKPSEAELISHELMLRAGLIAKVAAGIYDYLPLAWRSIKKIQQIMREEMDAVDGQEINMPVVHPADLWQESGRWYSVGPEMVRFKDRSGRDMLLAMTHEETVTDLARRFIDSYRQLPVVLYHIQTKFRDEPRSRGGLVRVREFIMKDAYSFHRDQASLDEYYPRQCRAYMRICRRCGVPVVQVLGDVGMMGGSTAHEFTYITDSGEDTLLLCPKCGYAANREAASISKRQEGSEHRPGSMCGSGTNSCSWPEKVHTPGKDTIPAVCEFLGVDSKASIKSMLYYTGDGRPVMVAIRGDLDVNEKKLANLLQASEVRLASQEEIQNLGLVQGFMSPVGVSGVTIVADDSLSASCYYVAGANEKDYHLLNVVPERDFSAHLTGDVALARNGDPCPQCGCGLEVKRGIEVGNVFKLGTKYSTTMGATYQDEDGTQKPIVMGCYGMGVGRLLACVIEANHDDKGIIWPITVAPYHIYLMSLGKSESVREETEELYSALVKQGREVLYDDRDETAGVKFNDADLLGMPVRVTISERTLKAGGAEVKLRREESATIVPFGDLDRVLSQLIHDEYRRFSVEEDV